ncbi:mRNA-capping enzyme subunit alpha [Frankliniella fusca]|uniref:mRNA-capping enzyme subunit alpha n=1 Tax=Frankliniella fusca TaxID=407009 RepID=A0AAE1LF48_9NEOP|nr:mRNA-capping enzyme subunit alpha [Frankliniella fusca]
MQDASQLESLRYDCSDVILPNVTVHMLMRCMDEATNRVTFGSSSEENSRAIAHSIRDNFITAIMNAASLSSETTTSELSDADTEIFKGALFVKTESQEMIEGVSDQKSERNCKVTSCNQTQNEKKHTSALTMDVPEFVVNCMRGVRCKICWFAIKGVNCVQRLIDHTIEFHPEKSSAVFLDNIREENSHKNVLGKGLPYCTCSTCIRIGYARWDKRLNANGRRTTRGIGKKCAF